MPTTQPTTPPTSSAGKPARGARLEAVAQVLILLTIGGTAAAASFTHVHNVAVAHGQPGWLAWADAIVLELMSIATGLEIRRRHRVGQPAGFVLWVLGGAVALSLSAQVVEAERSVVGWLAAALPALGFLASVKIVLARTPTSTVDTEPARTATDSAADSLPSAVMGMPQPDTGLRSIGRQGPVVTEPPTAQPATVTAAAAGRAGTVPIPPGSFTRANAVPSSGREIQ